MKIISMYKGFVRVDSIPEDFEVGQCVQSDISSKPFECVMIQPVPNGDYVLGLMSIPRPSDCVEVDFLSDWPVLDYEPEGHISDERQSERNSEH